MAGVEGTSEAVITGAGAPEEGGYRSLSAQALAALALGPASLVATVSPVFWVVPILGVVVALSALRKIAREPQRWSGSSLAGIGLLISAFFLAAAPAHLFARRDQLVAHARQTADTFLQLLQQDKRREVHQLHLFFEQRLPKGTSLDEHYKEPEVETDAIDQFGIAASPRAAMKEYFTDAVLTMVSQHLTEHAEDGGFRFERLVAVERVPAAQVDRVILEYALTAPNLEKRVWVYLRRGLYEEELPSWNVDGVSYPEQRLSL